MTITRSRIETSIPRKHGPSIAGYEKVCFLFLKEFCFPEIKLSGKPWVKYCITNSLLSLTGFEQVLWKCVAGNFNLSLLLNLLKISKIVCIYSNMCLYAIGFLEVCWFQCYSLCCDCKPRFHKGLIWICMSSHILCANCDYPSKPYFYKWTNY